MRLGLFISLVILNSYSIATTWTETEIDDPIFEGAKCLVHEPASYGSYIYNWPSKYDQVFWPLVDFHGIWHCEKSGFTAFIGDFSEISPGEISEIKDYLLRNPLKDSSMHSKLSALETIYSIRATDDEFDNQLLRVLARWSQNLGDLEKANDYRRLAFSDIQLKLRGELGKYQSLEYLYLAANYSRQFGDEKASDEYIIQLKSVIETIDSDNLKGFAEYLRELYPDTYHIEKGGVLDPELPE